MFPFPRGTCTWAIVRTIVITDVGSPGFPAVAWRQWLQPMGWETPFGLRRRRSRDRAKNSIPATGTERQNIAQMRAQLQRLGLSIDWDGGKGGHLCHADYLPRTQWLFLQFHEAGLGLRKEATVNWDPIDQTVLGQ